MSKMQRSGVHSDTDASKTTSGAESTTMSVHTDEKDEVEDWDLTNGLLTKLELMRRHLGGQAWRDSPWRKEISQWEVP